MRLLLLIVALLAAHSAAAHLEKEIERLLECARIESISKRVDCLDALGRELAAAEAEPDIAEVAPAAPETDVAPVAAASATLEAVVAPENATTAAPAASAVTETRSEESFGGDRFAIPEERGMEQLKTKVTACNKNSYGRYSFTLENGQTWRHVDSQRLTFKECEFPVTISKESLGYKMHIDQNGRWIRVKRIR
jgi:hypothetical protein